MNYNSYTEAVNAGLGDTYSKGFTTEPEELTDIIGFGSVRPKDGATTKLTIPIYKNGKKQKKHLQIQVYGRGTATHNYELNCYIL